MFIETEEINGIRIHYNSYVKRDLEDYGVWMPFTYAIAAAIFRFINDNFYYEKYKPEIMVNLEHDHRSRAIELSVRIRETGYGEMELFTMDIFTGHYADKHMVGGYIDKFVERFQKNIVRSAVMEKIDLYRNPPKPVVDWFTIKLAGLALGRSALKMALAFVVVAVFIIYLCLR